MLKLLLLAAGGPRPCARRRRLSVETKRRHPVAGHSRARPAGPASGGGDRAAGSARLGLADAHLPGPRCVRGRCHLAERCETVPAPAGPVALTSKVWAAPDVSPVTVADRADAPTSSDPSTAVPIPENQRTPVAGHAGCLRVAGRSPADRRRARRGGAVAGEPAHLVAGDTGVARIGGSSPGDRSLPRTRHRRHVGRSGRQRPGDHDPVRARRDRTEVGTADRGHVLGLVSPG
jgi:hypothetical protein